MKRLSILLLLSCFSPAIAQDLKVEWTSLEDHRGSENFSRCELKLKIFGQAVGNAKLFRLDTALIVLDDKGNKLVSSDTFGFDAGEFEEIKLRDGAIEKSLRLLNPSRAATMLTTVKGKVELFNPSLDPQSVIVVKGFINKPNQTLLLTKNPDLDVFYIDQESYKFLQQAEKEKIDKQLAQLNTNDQLPAKAFIDNFFEFMKAGSGANAVNFYVKDAKQQFFQFEFRDENGELAKPNSTMSSENYYSFGFRKPVTNAWQLTILLKTPKSVLVKPFELKNIKLP